MARRRSTAESVVAVVVTWNSRDYVDTCLDSLLASAPPSDIIVVDNASQDGTAQHIRAKYQDVTVINAGENLGYAAGNNLGICRALEWGTEYVLLVNPDCVVAADCIARLVAAAAQGGGALVSPKIFRADPPDRLWYAGGDINWVFGTTYHRGADSLDRGQFDRTSATERISGAAVLVETDAIRKVGLMRPEFFLYYEESDWSVRFSRAGYTLLFEPSAVCWHAVSTSSRESSPIYYYYMTRNQLLFVWLHRRRFLPTTFAYLVVVSLLRWLGWIVRGEAHIQLFCATSRGFIDFTLGRFGCRHPPQWVRS